MTCSSQEARCVAYSDRYTVEGAEGASCKVERQRDPYYTAVVSCAFRFPFRVPSGTTSNYVYDCSV